MQLIDGKAIADQIKKEIAAEVEEIKAAGGKIPHLAAILVGVLTWQLSSSAMTEEVKHM